MHHNARAGGASRSQDPPEREAGGKIAAPIRALVFAPRHSVPNHVWPVFLFSSNIAEKWDMPDALKPMTLSVEKDLSGGVRVGFGGSVGLMSPEQTVEFAMVLLKTAGVEVNLGPQFQMPKQRMFRAG